MKIELTTGFENALMGLGESRAFAVLDLIDEAGRDQTGAKVGLRPLVEYGRGFVMQSRHGDVVVLMPTADGCFQAVDVGPYATVLRHVKDQNI